MEEGLKRGRFTKEEILAARAKESEQFEEFYHWIEDHMPPAFFDEMTHTQLMLIVHNLIGFHLNENFTHIHLKNCAIVLCLDSPDADVKVLQLFSLYGIKNYQTFVSDSPPPFDGVNKKLRIALLYFTEFKDSEQTEDPIPAEKQKAMYEICKELSEGLSFEQFQSLLEGMNARFLRSMTEERLKIALEMFFRAKTRDHCQYHVQKNEDWQAHSNAPSCQIILAWRNTPKYRFLFRLAKMIFRHGLSMRKVNVTYLNPYSKDSILLMSLGLHGINGKEACVEADMKDFLQELVTLKYFSHNDIIEKEFIDTSLIRGNLGNLLRNIVTFIHQSLVHADVNLYSVDNIEEAFCRHPEFTLKICEIFELKFHPKKNDQKKYDKTRKEFLEALKELDTGHEINDIRRKNIFRQAINFVKYCLKTNFYRNNKSAFSFRLDPTYLNHVPYDRFEVFPELPYGIFFIQGMHFFGFHIRFKNLSRGGLRTIFPKALEQMVIERNQVFSECYNLAYTQQKKNKDIPEGGSKAVILLEPFNRLNFENDIYKKELLAADFSEEEIAKTLEVYNNEQRLEYLYQSQRAFVHSMMTLINYETSSSPKIRAKDVIDFYKRPEYIYLGPDENMHNEMIEWIATYSEKCQYAIGKAFISSKPSCGINHKMYGVTSLGVHVYMQEVLNYLEIDPELDEFTVKITGGPDGDVAGNQLLNLYRDFPKTAKVLALIDGSGTAYDPNGFCLEQLVELFQKGLPISCYPPEKLSDGGFLLDVSQKKEESSYSKKTLCWRKENGRLEKDWLSGSDMNHLLRCNVHQTKTDIFITAGGRPRTLNEDNYKDFLDETGSPTSSAIVEGANLYLTPEARRELEKLGVLIIKDSSANKGGVICSSLEVLCGLCMTEKEFMDNKTELMEEITTFIKYRAHDEARLLLKTFAHTGAHLTDISEWVSERINSFTYQLLDHLEKNCLCCDEKDPLIRCLINYCPEYLRRLHKKDILKSIPDPHKKAIISCFIASKLVYKRGLEWSPSIVDVLPLIAEDINLQDPDIDIDLEEEIK